MTQSSFFGYHLSTSNARFVDGAAIDTPHAFLVRNNIAHAIDESPHGRVVWGAVAVDSLSDPTERMAPILYRGGDIAQIYEGLLRHWEFPLTWLGPDRPANLDVVVGFGGEDFQNDEDITCRVTICPANVPLFSGQNALLDTTATCASGASSSIAAYVIGTYNLGTLAGAWEAVGAQDEGGQLWQPRLCMLRLEVSVLWTTFGPATAGEPPDDYDNVWISGVICREYG